jgi:hypothetical protein
VPDFQISFPYTLAGIAVIEQYKVSDWSVVGLIIGGKWFTICNEAGE